MSWNFFTNTGSLKTSGQIAAGVSTVASASAIAVNTGYTILLTGTTAVNTMTGGVTGGVVRLIASAQATGVCVVLNNAATSNALSLRDSANFGIYAGESVTFVYNGTYWVEVSRNLKTVLDNVLVSSVVNITQTVEASSDTIATHSAITFDGATAIKFGFYGGVEIPPASQATVRICLFDSTTSLGFYRNQAEVGVSGSYGGSVVDSTHIRRFVPAAGSKTYSWRGYRTGNNGSVRAGAAGAGNDVQLVCQISRDL